jgi:hypothetical protein
MAYTSYVALLQGLLQATDERGGESKLRFFFKFRWTNSLQPDIPMEQQDALYDLIHVSITLALWYMKHAAYLASKEGFVLFPYRPSTEGYIFSLNSGLV